MRRFVRAPFALLIASVVAGCGASSKSPASPSSSATATSSASQVSLSGLVYAAGAGASGGVPNAKIEIADGPDLGKGAMTDATGHYRLDGLDPGAATLRVSATGYLPANQSVTLASNATTDVALVPTSRTAAGTLLDAISGGHIANMTIRTDSGSSASDAGGGFSLDANLLDAIAIDVTGPGYVERRTSISTTAGPASVTLIPSGFDLAAFDQMFRSPQLSRWTSAPPLVVQTTVMQFGSLNDTSFAATGTAIGGGEVSDLVNDLTWALPQMTGGAFGAFAGTSTPSAAAGSIWSPLASGSITVARYQGLTAATGYWGFSRALSRGDGTVVGGAIMIDADFDRANGPYRRALRSHELGHALGYNHVTARASVMNAEARTEPNDFDRQASRVAFSRTPGNRSPDVDPPAYLANINAVPAATWGPAIR